MASDLGFCCAVVSWGASGMGLGKTRSSGQGPVLLRVGQGGVFLAPVDAYRSSACAKRYSVKHGSTHTV